MEDIEIVLQSTKRIKEYSRAADERRFCSGVNVTPNLLERCENQQPSVVVG